MREQYITYMTINEKWAKQIPSHWLMKRLKNVFSLRKEKNNPVQTDHILSLTAKQGVIPYSEKEGAGGNKPKEDLTQYNICHINDLLVNNMNIVSGAAGVSKYFGAISPVYYAFFPHKNVNVWYYHYLFRLITFHRSLIGLGKGILMHESENGVLSSVRMRISMNYLGNVLLPFPPRNEQDQIVRFLDWKVSAINKLIKTKKWQINSYKELAKAKIESQLNNYPIEKNVLLKNLGMFFKGGGFSRKDLIEDNKYPAILYGDIYTQYEYKTSTINHFIDSDTYTASRKIINGDIVMAGTGETKEEIGKPILYTGNQMVAVGGDIIVFRPYKMGNAEYLLYQLYSQAALKHRYINGKGDIIVHIYPTTLGNTPISLPSDSDQMKAVEKINKIISQTNKTTALLIEEITTLKEFKTRLISDVVTGQIDVRNIEIPEYEYVDEELESDSDDVDGDFDSEDISEEA